MKEYKYTINGTLYTVAVGDIDNNVAQVEVNGTPYKVELQRKSGSTVTVVKSPKPEAAPRTASGEKVVAKPTASTGAGVGVKAPLPGVILSVNCKVGDTVSANDTVVVLEAMKMENAIKAGRDGKVTAINVANGQSVLEGETLISIS
ncbi:MAG: acetyl-CoA carboxylase biotin carboxyl carrier protein subunit [Muribaculaceae bacterium]|nr:acetyl-CoA carboxylase biotin carboxyl carrier protein subunit [Muribaculaceae bacterium]